MLRTKFLSDEWMVARGFMEAPVSEIDPWWSNQTISHLKELLKPVDDYIIDEGVDCSKALQILKSKSIDCLLQFENGFFNFFTRSFEIFQLNL